MAGLVVSEDLSFEDFKNQNGITYWWASEFMLMLGYPDMQSFKKAIDRATRAFISLGIDHYENIICVDRVIDGIEKQDFKLTRFACYLIAMNADPKKREVALVQTYFAEQTRKFELYVENPANIDRVLIRDEIKDGNKSLNATVKKAGVEDYARFTNAGYLGMYNMMNVQLAKRRNIDKDKLFETMGRTELAANLFRITQTEERIKSQHIHGQEMLEQTHHDVGREVRNIIIKNSGKAPEQLVQEKKIPDVKKTLKSEFKEMKKIDKNK
jgi:DNA-damage-inducible protein D